MLAAGQALVAPVALTAGCRTYLRDAERVARTAKLGLWGDPYYVVRQANNIADILAEQGRFAVVEGKVAVGSRKRRHCVCEFGGARSQDFTQLTILARNERLFTGAGLAPKALTGRQVEVRGWIEERGGPAIECGAAGADRNRQLEADRS